MVRLKMPGNQLSGYAWLSIRTQANGRSLDIHEASP